MYHKIVAMGLGLCLLLMTTAAAAMAQGIRDLSVDELKQRLDQPRRIVVVDTRTAQEYRQGHISGAINISSPESDQFQRMAHLLPENKDIPLVFYCRGYD
ncbi:rhodanese-like domain-containing protein [Desulfurivibrio sp. D14AmB]|uniref:rhodanese-like domain-containing protein n=1 Tax=Desulfurivibrio sp. D14AmB TaxID=3374370 RepID=UPI00376F144F